MWQYNRTNDELYHGKFKYIDKKFVKGKWRYYYTGDYVNGKDKGRVVGVSYQKTKGSPKSKYGTYKYNRGGETATVTVKKSNKLLNSTSTNIIPKTNANDVTQTRYVGKIEQTTDKVSKNFSMFKKQSANQINKGKTAILKFLSKFK